ncbi:hypothetical protein SD80_015725 [Scytonema tolypothrichoides VB-61278]|nr:hypothetical protein SD80_015725 [Scytonema tolypothrichoides VB-61278]
MSRLQISDLNFCETASNTEVQGGFSIKPKLGLDLFSLLTLYTPEFDKISSVEKGEEVVEEFRDPVSGGYRYQVTSKDGKTQLSVATWSKDNTSFTTAFGRSTS